MPKASGGEREHVNIKCHCVDTGWRWINRKAVREVGVHPRLDEPDQINAFIVHFIPALGDGALYQGVDQSQSPPNPAREAALRHALSIHD